METTPHSPRRRRRFAPRRRRGPVEAPPREGTDVDRDYPDSLTEVLAHQVSGRLEDLSLSDVVQMLTLGNKTACLSLYHRESQGTIWFVDGRATHACTGDLEGEAAFFAMVGWDTGRFVITHGITASRRSLEQDTMFLVMEGMRLLEEADSAVTGGPAAAQPETAGVALLADTADVPMTVSGEETRLAWSRRLLWPALGVLLVAAAVQTVPSLGTSSATPDETAAQATPIVPRALSDWEAFWVAPAASEGGPAIEFRIGAAAPPVRARNVVSKAVPEVEVAEEPAPVGVVDRGPAPLLFGAPAQQAVPAIEPGGVLLLHRAPVIVPVEMVRTASIELQGTNRFSSGRLVVLVDGREVFSRDLAARRSGGAFRKKQREAFAATIPVTPGAHRVIARVIGSEKGDHAGGLSMSARAGETLKVELATGGIRRLQLRSE